MDDEELRKWHAKFDQRERPGRVQRNAAVLRWLEPYEGALLGGGRESVLALAEARDAYIYGLPLASLFASHVACERTIARASVSPDASLRVSRQANGPAVVMGAHAPTGM
jgi:hypothetical protein